MGYGYYGFRPYVSVGERRRRAQKEMDKLKKKGVDVQPIEIEGRKIARTFWGEAWCDHLESFSDFANRLPRGRTYVRNGSVCHLAITQGHVEAIVSGSELYNVTVNIKTLPKKKWDELTKRCTGQIGSLLDLLTGQLSESIMQVVADRKEGLFPLPGEIKFDCDCPDWASMCKHVAAVLYGVGSRFDHRPELLFELRGVDVEELIEADAENAIDTNLKTAAGKELDQGELAHIFGIEISAPGETPSASPKTKSKKSTKTSRAKPKSAKTTTKKKSPAKKRTAKTSTKKKTKASAKKKKTKASAKRKKPKPAQKERNREEKNQVQKEIWLKSAIKDRSRKSSPIVSRNSPAPGSPVNRG